MVAIPRRQVKRQLGLVLMRVRPGGLQNRARRNAWSAMVADRQRRVERAAAELALAAAATVTAVPATGRAAAERHA